MRYIRQIKIKKLDNCSVEVVLFLYNLTIRLPQKNKKEVGFYDMDI
ncbi:hypothetical protein [Haliovirga abyssi]|uniref:Uncharacterized protein n=1 Tax=Haliovirga abyssi TaxID=2996794 RepID=A0AAU9D592_9FUSO|nr:hypothetical protein [Haliovirga abyssi]BDU49728.1 hypothetical protein HLVA_02970 [Haliovirga abyssi]